jgi:AT hook motif
MTSTIKSVSTAPIKSEGDDETDIVVQDNSSSPDDGQVQESHRREEWMLVVKLLEVNDSTTVEKLQTAGISCMDDVQQALFGQDSTSSLLLRQYDALQKHLSLLQLQKLRVIATYLSNDGKLLESTNLNEMARANSHCCEYEPLVKRGRGRPRKHPLESVGLEKSAKRPRGRPRKQTTLASSNLEPTVKRPRGRPRKHALESSDLDPPAKRPRGRPRKHTVKRPPGRPRKHTLASSDTEPTAKRRIGRPRKHTVKRPPGRPRKPTIASPDMGPPAKRPRGRPRKHTVKRPPGRPRSQTVQETTSPKDSNSSSPKKVKEEVEVGYF